MQIRTAKFIKGIVKEDEMLEDGKPQIAFIGRSNVGKSSVINALTKQKDLARTSSFPGRTQEINLFLINNAFYFVDLPGYGYAKLSKTKRAWIQDLINWYFFDSPYQQKKIVLIIDANVGVTENDLEMIKCMDEEKKDVILIANKIDKIKIGSRQNQLAKIQAVMQKHGSKKHKIIPFSAEKKIGVQELSNEISA